ncbi:MAG: right-handed parallel beta-helix repeat-containing protein, partial [Clostridia bacterium]|nr:right-handed parallel beta-helix repeat-containing protein [Clostridia bacterium]
PERADLTPFADDEKTSAWAKESLEWAVEAGLINGTDGNRLAPGGLATREQFAAIIERYDGSFKLVYNEPILRSHYTEKEYPLVTDADIYVSTDGDDNAAGDFDHPLATFSRAAEKAREIRAAGTSGDIVVAFKAGDYGPLSVTLTAGDSGTTEQKTVFCKYGDGDVTFDNGVGFEAGNFEPVSEAEKEMFNAKYADQIKKADLSALYDLGLSEKDIYLFYSGGLCDKARYPNKYSDNTDQLLAMAETVDETHLLITMNMMHERLLRYDEKCFDTMEIWGYIVRGYRKDTFKIIGYDKDSRLLEVGESSTTEFGGHLRVDEGLWAGVDGEGVEMCYMNVPYELDYKGEYWIDPETKTLYVYAPEGSYFIPGPGTMITMDHADDVSFRGLTFKNAAGGFINASMCHGVTLELCEFNGTSAKEGVRFDNNSYERPMGLTIRECDFTNAYGHSVYVYGGCEARDRFLKRTDVVFDNNRVTRSNLVYDEECAVYMPDCCGLTVTHNDFGFTSRGSFAFGGSYDVLVEYNEFTDNMKNSDDGGALRCISSADGWNIHVRHNFFGQIDAGKVGAYGFYVDDNSCGLEISENLFWDAGNPIMIHLGRDNLIRDNVFIKGGAGFSVSQRRDIEAAGPEGGQAPGEAGKTWTIWRRIFNYIDTYPEYRAGIEQWCPEVLNYHLDYGKMDDRYFVMNPVNFLKDNVYINNTGKTDVMGEKYTKIYVSVEGSRGYTFEENPLFVNPTSGDYRIREGADFPNVEFEKIGRY